MWVGLTHIPDSVFLQTSGEHRQGQSVGGGLAAEWGVGTPPQSGCTCESPGVLSREFPGLHAKLRQVLGGKGQVLSINLKVTSS